MLRYGLIKKEHLEDIVLVVCNILGHGKNKKAMNLLLETASVETKSGTAKDGTIYAGMGITQFDKMPFYDIKHRTSQRSKDAIKNALDIDIDLVEWEHLRYNPLLAMIFTRLKYIKVPAEIPSDMLGRAEYWKKWYNSELGKGTVDHYIASSQLYYSNIG